MNLIINILYSCILINIFISCIADNSLDFCPTSKIVKSDETGLFSYPTDLFNQENINIDKYYDCKFDKDETIRKCPNRLNSCPINNEDVIATRVKSSTWDYKHSLCNSLDKKNFNNKRVIIFGGSVTSGSSTDGCFCDTEVNKECPKNTPDVEDTKKFCKWGSRLNEWWKNEYSNSTVTVIAIGGVASPLMADFLELKLRQNHISNLNRNDIILIDHSVNDGTSLYSKDGNEELVQGLDRFIRNIYKFSVPGSWPSIILLEMWPYTNRIKDVNKSPDKLSDDQLKYDYSKTYVETAKTYGLQIWSYRDLVWSDYIQNQYDKYTLNYLRFISFIIHPPWAVHVYYADLVANNLLYEADLCKSGKNKDHIKDTKEMYLDKLKPASKDPSLDCKVNTDGILDLYATSFIAEAHDNASPKIGRFTTSSSDSFVLYADRLNKYGWIDEISSNDENYQKNFHSNITFYFNNKNNILNDKLYILKVYYFRTYLNGGLFDVTLCGENIRRLDTLWTEVKYHSSVTKVFQFLLNPSEHKYCLGSNVATLTFTHIYGQENAYNTRAKQKVKLVGVKICESSLNE